MTVHEGETSGLRVDARTLLARLPDATILIDTLGTVVWMNDGAEDRLGLPRTSMIGRSGLELVHPDDLAAAEFSMATVQGKRVGTPIEIRLRTASGWRVAEVIGAPVDDDHIVLTLRDLTDRRRWEVAGRDEAKLRGLVQNAPTLFLLLDGAGRVVASSGAVARTLGHDQAGLEQRPLTDLVHEDDHRRLRAAIRRACSTDDPGAAPERVEVRLLDRTRDEFVPHELSILDRLDDPTVAGLVVTGHDVSDRVDAEQELRRLLSLQRATLDAIGDGVIAVDLAGRVTSFNTRCADMWHLPRDLLRPGMDQEVIRHVALQFDDPDEFLARVTELYRRPEEESFDVLTFSDGRVFERTTRPQRLGDEVVGRVWSFRDITRQQQLERELAHQAFHDSLTGLSNQALFRDRVAHATARADRDGSMLAVLYLDLDDFKRVNDSLGHPAGDRLLVEVADRLRRCVREVDTAARLGGDEFAVLVEDLDRPDEAIALAERLVQQLRRPLRLWGREIVTGVSLGVAFNHHGAGADQLLRNADLAMYAAKRRGKGTFEVYDPTMHQHALARLEIEGALRVARDRDQFRLVYQPVVELATGTMIGVEALLRWDHPELGQLLPGSFLDAAEDLGLMPEIGSFVIETACAQARDWAALVPDDVPFTVAVNVSAGQLADGAVVTQLAAELAEGSLDASRLVVELTETAMLGDTTAAVRTLRALKSLGVRLALDDFGTGFSSLTHLQQLPIDILKIDRSFLHQQRARRRPRARRAAARRAARTQHGGRGDRVRDPRPVPAVARLPARPGLPVRGAW